MSRYNLNSTCEQKFSLLLNNGNVCIPPSNCHSINNVSLKLSKIVNVLYDENTIRKIKLIIIIKKKTKT